MAKRAPVVSVINMKGGVGKTTIATNLSFAFWAHHSLNVLMVDFDPQANLTQLQLTARQYADLTTSGRTLWHALEPVQSDSLFNISTSDWARIGDLSTYILPMRADGERRLDLLPGDWRLAKLSLREDRAALKLNGARFANLINAARAEYDLVVLDCNPASSHMTRWAIEQSTHMFVPVTLNRYAILGLDMIFGYVKGFPGIHRPPRVNVLINEIQGSLSSRIIRDLRAHRTYGRITLAEQLRKSTLLEASPSPSRRGFAAELPFPNKERVGGNFKAIAGEYGKILGVAP